MNSRLTSRIWEEVRRAFANRETIIESGSISFRGRICPYHAEGARDGRYDVRLPARPTHRPSILNYNVDYCMKYRRAGIFLRSERCTKLRDEALRVIQIAPGYLQKC